MKASKTPLRAILTALTTGAVLLLTGCGDSPHQYVKTDGTPVAPAFNDYLNWVAEAGNNGEVLAGEKLAGALLAAVFACPIPGLDPERQPPVDAALKAQATPELCAAIAYNPFGFQETPGGSVYPDGKTSGDEQREWLCSQGDTSQC